MSQAGSQVADQTERKPDKMVTLLVVCMVYTIYIKLGRLMVAYGMQPNQLSPHTI